MHISWQLIVLSLAYVGVLFIIAWQGDRNTASFGGVRASRWVYPLSIGVYATSWTYYGAVGSAAAHGWEFHANLCWPNFSLHFWLAHHFEIQCRSENTPDRIVS